MEVGPSPVFADGLVYIANQSPALSAIRPDGRGELKAVWTADDGLPDTCSPLATSQYVMLLTSGGTLTCYEAKKGKKLWEQDFDVSFKASPAMAGPYVYLFSDAEEGKCFVVEPHADGCKKVSEGAMGEGCTASPAFQDGRIYARGKKHLICIGTK
jgi:outer membrane protein assembly factor BamB